MIQSLKQLEKDLAKYYSFTDFFKDYNNYSKSILRIPIESYKKSDKVIITAEVPGINKEDISIDSENGYLRISVEKKIKNSSDDLKYTEISYGKISRLIDIGENTDEDNIQASLKDGILTIEVGYKTEQKEKLKKIPIL